MPMNRIQFQAGLSLAEFLALYGTEAQCEVVLAQARWPAGFQCPRCRCERHCVLERNGHKLWQCYRCHHQPTLVAGTVFEATKLPLTKWFLAMFLITQAKNNISALSLKRQLGVSYPTAWLVKHKLMDVMAQRECRRELAGRVEMDDAYLGGERTGKRGRGAIGRWP